MYSTLQRLGRVSYTEHLLSMYISHVPFSKALYGNSLTSWLSIPEAKSLPTFLQHNPQDVHGNFILRIASQKPQQEQYNDDARSAVLPHKQWLIKSMA